MGPFNIKLFKFPINFKVKQHESPVNIISILEKRKDCHDA